MLGWPENFTQIELPNCSKQNLSQPLLFNSGMCMPHFVEGSFVNQRHLHWDKWSKVDNLLILENIKDFVLSSSPPGISSKEKLSLPKELLSTDLTKPQISYQLVLATVEVMAVVEDIFICRVQAGFHTILYHLAGSWGALQFLHLPVNIRNTGLGSCSPRWDILPSFLQIFFRFISPFPGLQTLPGVMVWVENIPHRLMFS